MQQSGRCAPTTARSAAARALRGGSASSECGGAGASGCQHPAAPAVRTSGARPPTFLAPGSRTSFMLMLTCGWPVESLVSAPGAVEPARSSARACSPRPALLPPFPENQPQQPRSRRWRSPTPAAAPPPCPNAGTQPAPPVLQRTNKLTRGGAHVGDGLRRLQQLRQRLRALGPHAVIAEVHRLELCRRGGRERQPPAT